MVSIEVPDSSILQRMTFFVPLLFIMNEQVKDVHASPPERITGQRRYLAVWEALLIRYDVMSGRTLYRRNPPLPQE